MSHSNMKKCLKTSISSSNEQKLKKNETEKLSIFVIIIVIVVVVSDVPSIVFLSNDSRLFTLIRMFYQIADSFFFR